MKRFRLYVVLVSLLAVTSLVFIFSCGGAGNDLAQEYIKVIGVAQMLVKSAGLTSKATTDPSTANAIMPAWYDQGAWQFGDIITVGSDGSFSVDLPADSDRCLILLMDTAQTNKIDQIVGYVAIGVDSEHNLLNFPASEAKGDINLGTIEQDTNNPDEVSSDASTVSSVANFNLSLDELKQMASNDKLLKSIKNWYANNHGDYWYGLNPVYILYIPNGINTVENITKTPQDILTDIQNNNGEIYYQLLWSPSRKEDNPFSSYFSGNSISITIPNPMTPTSIEMKDNSDSISSISAGTEIPSNYWSGNEDSSSVQKFLGAVPEGQWIVKKDGVEIARYEFNQQNPIIYDSSGNADYFNVFVPVIKINTTSSIVDSIDIQWYLYDGTTYKTVDPSSKAFLDVVDYFEMELTDLSVTETFEIGSEGGTVGGNISISDTHVTPSKEWIIGTAGSGQYQLTSVTVQYEIYGTRFMFDYRYTSP